MFDALARRLGLRARRASPFMVEMEVPPRGSFYLVPRPIFADESGGGTVDGKPAAFTRPSPLGSRWWTPASRGAAVQRNTDVFFKLMRAALRGVERPE